MRLITFAPLSRCSFGPLRPRPTARFAPPALERAGSHSDNHGGRFPVGGGRMRAGTRRPSPCRASIGRAQEDQDRPTEQAHGGAAGGGRRRAGYGTAGRARRVSLRGGPTFAKKDNARSRLCTNPAGPLIGVTVSLSGPPFSCTRK